MPSAVVEVPADDVMGKTAAFVAQADGVGSAETATDVVREVKASVVAVHVVGRHTVVFPQPADPRRTRATVAVGAGVDPTSAAVVTGNRTGLKAVECLQVEKDSIADASGQDEPQALSGRATAQQGVAGGPPLAASRADRVSSEFDGGAWPAAAGSCSSSEPTRFEETARVEMPTESNRAAQAATEPRTLESRAAWNRNPPSLSGDSCAGNSGFY